MGIAKYRFIERITRNDEIILAYNNKKGGGGFMRSEGHLGESIDFLMERNDEIKDFILDSACAYLRKYEIQKQEFAKRLYNND